MSAENSAKIDYKYPSLLLAFLPPKMIVPAHSPHHDGGGLSLRLLILVLVRACRLVVLAVA